MIAHPRRSPRTLIPAALLALLTALGLLLAPSGGARAADDVTWTVRTASNDFGSSRTSYSYTINPGATVADALVVANRGATELDLGVYAADGYTTESGQFDLLVGDKKSSSIGAWVHSDQDRITVAPGATVEVPFTVTVPENASPGDYAGGIVTSLAQPDAAQGITVDRRLGVRIALRVAGDLRPGLAVEDLHVGWNGGLNPFAGGDATVTYTLRNTGNAVLSARQTAGIGGPFGWFPTAAGKVDEPPQLLPGESWRMSVPVRDVPATVWLTATATVTPVVVDASGSTTALEPVEATGIGWALPWMLLLILLVLAALVVLAVRLLRRRRAGLRAREDERVRRAVEQALANAPVEGEEPATSGR